MIQELRTAFWVLSIGLMTYSACGPDTAQTEDGASTTTGDDASSTDSPTDSPTGSSTGAPNHAAGFTRETSMYLRIQTSHPWQTSGEWPDNWPSSWESATSAIYPS